MTPDQEREIAAWLAATSIADQVGRLPQASGWVRDLLTEVRALREAKEHLEDWMRAANQFAWAHERDCPRHDTDAPCTRGLDTFLSRPRVVVESVRALREEIRCVSSDRDSWQRASQEHNNDAIERRDSLARVRGEAIEECKQRCMAEAAAYREQGANASMSPDTKAAYHHAAIACERLAKILPALAASVPAGPPAESERKLGEALELAKRRETDAQVAIALAAEMGRDKGLEEAAILCCDPFIAQRIRALKHDAALASREPAGEGGTK